jgi:surface polysaccharide O-acyltransferase-like enzyme
MMFFAGLVLVSAVAYLPMQLAFGAESWVKFGPFFLQTSRFLHYGVYFFAGVAAGAVGIDHSLVARDGRLAQRWSPWMFAAVIMFLVDVLWMVTISRLAADYGLPPLARHLLSGLMFVLCCAVTSFALLALFLRFTETHTPILDSLARNAYGIYLVHFGFVLWLQYALLPAALPAAAKVAVVFPGAVLTSWIVIAALRRIPVVARVI